MKFSRVIFGTVFFISFISACLAFFITVTFQYKSYQNDKKHLEEELAKIQIMKKSLSLEEYIIIQQELIESEILRKEETLQDTIINQIGSLLLLIYLSTLLFYFISRKVSTFIDHNINHLIDAFKKAIKSHKEIDVNNLTYKEFSVLAQKMNQILRDRNRTHSKLEDYVKIVDDNVSISSSDKDGNITAVSDAFCKHTGYVSDELVGQPYNLLLERNIADTYYKEMWKNLQKGLKWTGEIQAKKKSGELYWAQTIIHAEYVNDKISSYTAIKHDITEKKALEQLTMTDDLTGLYNKRYFKIKIDEEINRAKRNNRYISFMLLDIDYFKKYNDTYGHLAGDEALVRVASVLEQYTNRACDFAFRVGGEEFCLLFSSDTVDKSLKFSNLLKSSIEELNIEHKTSDVNIFLTVSIGLVVKKGLEISASREIYMNADKALYKAKEMGRNRVCLQNS